jgi:hypothetical protein
MTTLPPSHSLLHAYSNSLTVTDSPPQASFILQLALACHMYPIPPATTVKCGPGLSSDVCTTDATRMLHVPWPSGPLPLLQDGHVSDRQLDMDFGLYTHLSQKEKTRQVILAKLWSVYTFEYRPKSHSILTVARTPNCYPTASLYPNPP